jgi:hypothetical protein
LVEHLCQAFPANTLIALQRLHALAFGCGTFAYAKDQASLPLDGLLKGIPDTMLLWFILESTLMLARQVLLAADEK